jgi:chemotaxis family two-component system response regulator PixG
LPNRIAFDSYDLTNQLVREKCVRSTQQTPPIISAKLFSAGKQIQFLETLKRLRFSGQLVFTSSKEEQWVFYLYLGQIMYATGGVHPVRRFQRNLAVHCTQMLVNTNRSTLQQDLVGLNATASTLCWEYKLLSLWVAQKKITSQQASNMIQAVVAEVLFDLAQAMRVIYQINPDNSLSNPLVLIDVHEALAKLQQSWQVWRNSMIADYSPNSAPLIKQPAEMRKRTSDALYQRLAQLLNGQRTLRDLAVQMQQDVVQVIRSLLPYIQWEWVELMSIPDLPSPVDTPVPETPRSQAESKGSLIACVDDSPLVRQTMQSLLSAAGYQFLGVDDAMRAFGILLARKPDLIFLDLVMPNANGYEICAQLRKLACFRNTPIVILTGNDGIVDRVRAKLVGASDFLSKPVDAGIVLSVIRKHLKQGVQA